MNWLFPVHFEYILHAVAKTKKFLKTNLSPKNYAEQNSRDRGKEKTDMGRQILPLILTYRPMYFHEHIFYDMRMPALEQPAFNKTIPFS